MGLDQPIASREMRLRARIDDLTDQRDALADRVAVLEKQAARPAGQLRDMTASRDAWRERAKAAEWGLRHQKRAAK